MAVDEIATTCRMIRGNLAMPTKQHQRPERKHSVILNALGWIYTGTRFVSPMSSDAVAAMHFESWGAANAIADHLRNLGITDGITVKKAKHENGVTFRFRHPMIPDAAGPSKYEWRRNKAPEPEPEAENVAEP